MKVGNNTQSVIHNTAGYQAGLQEMTAIKGTKGTVCCTLEAKQLQKRQAFWSLNNPAWPSDAITFPMEPLRSPPDHPRADR